MTVIDVGDRGIAVNVVAALPAERMARVRGMVAALLASPIEGVCDVVPSPGRVTVVYDPLRVSHAAVRHRVEEVVAGDAIGLPDAAATDHEIPVCYGGEFGPDLDEVCTAHALDRDQLIALHTAPRYLVEAIGFLPGFAYLTGLPPAVATPRRATPRRVVPAGSVGIGGAQTGAYPFSSPGGWNLIGNTPARLFDASRPRPATLAAGDSVRFVAIDPGQHDRLRETVAAEAARRRHPGRGIAVLKPGLFTTIQDLGRPGHRASGVPLCGAADPGALRRANRLVGNPADAAGLELTLLGPDLRFDQDTLVALEGATFPGCPWGHAFPVRAGDVISLGHATTGCRGLLAVAGGIDVEPVLGSRSTFVPARLGGLHGAPLIAGDELPIGDSRGRPVSPADPAAAAERGGAVTLRLIPGTEFDACGDAIWSATHTASSRSDRMGVRLEGPPLGLEGDRGSLPSVAVLPGTVQLPPDGRPIILLADAQTIGGYPVIGHVITADLPLVAQLRPGDAVRWRPATIAEAHRALRDQDGGS